MPDDCELLDDFLSGDLPADKADRFTAHLASCEYCRAEIDEDRWIERLLQSSERLELESPSPALLEGIRSTLMKSRQRAGMLACGLAAAVLLIAAGWIALSGGLSSEEYGGLVAEGDPPRQFVHAVVTGENVIVVPVESPDPQVTIVRLFPTFQPDEGQVIETSPSAEEEFDGPAWLEETHGDAL
jgi:anti-sigma factor RsiW